MFDLVDAVFGLVLCALAYGALWSVSVIADRYETRYMTPDWSMRARKRELDARDWRAEA